MNNNSKFSCYPLKDCKSGIDSLEGIHILYTSESKKRGIFNLLGRLFRRPVVFNFLFWQMVSRALHVFLETLRELGVVEIPDEQFYHKLSGVLLQGLYDIARGKKKNYLVTNQVFSIGISGESFRTPGVKKRIYYLSLDLKLNFSVQAQRELQHGGARLKAKLEEEMSGEKINIFKFLLHHGEIGDGWWLERLPLPRWEVTKLEYKGRIADFVVLIEAKG